MKASESALSWSPFPAAIISCAVRWYFRFQLSLRDIEESPFERGAIVSAAYVVSDYLNARRLSLRASAQSGNTSRSSDIFYPLRSIADLTASFPAWYRFTELAQFPSAPF
jgi:hypothetical protein